MTVIYAFIITLQVLKENSFTIYFFCFRTFSVYLHISNLSGLFTFLLLWNFAIKRKIWQKVFCKYRCRPRHRSVQGTCNVILLWTWQGFCSSLFNAKFARQLQAHGSLNPFPFLLMVLMEYGTTWEVTHPDFVFYEGKEVIYTRYVEN